MKCELLTGVVENATLEQGRIRNLCIVRHTLSSSWDMNVTSKLGQGNGGQVNNLHIQLYVRAEDSS